MPQVSHATLRLTMGFNTVNHYTAEWLNFYGKLSKNQLNNFRHTQQPITLAKVGLLHEPVTLIYCFEACSTSSRPSKKYLTSRHRKCRSAATFHYPPRATDEIADSCRFMRAHVQKDCLNTRHCARLSDTLLHNEATFYPRLAYIRLCPRFTIICFHPGHIGHTS